MTNKVQMPKAAEFVEFLGFVEFVEFVGWRMESVEIQLRFVEIRRLIPSPRIDSKEDTLYDKS